MNYFSIFLNNIYSIYNVTQLTVFNGLASLLEKNP